MPPFPSWRRISIRTSTLTACLLIGDWHRYHWLSSMILALQSEAPLSRLDWIYIFKQLTTYYLSHTLHCTYVMNIYITSSNFKIFKLHLTLRISEYVIYSICIHIQNLRGRERGSDGTALPNTSEVVAWNTRGRTASSYKFKKAQPDLLIIKVMLLYQHSNNYIYEIS